MVTKAIHQCDFSRAMSVIHKSMTVVTNGIACMRPWYQSMNLIYPVISISETCPMNMGHIKAQKTMTTMMLTA